MDSTGAVAIVEYSLAGLLLMAAIAKARRPQPTSQGLHAVGLPSGTSAVWIIALLEGAAAAFVLAFGGRGSLALMAFAFGSFTAYLVLARRSNVAFSSCGCFGTEDVPVTRTHLCFASVMFVACLVGVALGGVSPLITRPFGWKLLDRILLSSCLTLVWFALLDRHPRLISAVPRTFPTVRERFRAVRNGRRRVPLTLERGRYGSG